MFCLGFSLLYQSPVPKVFSVMVLIFCFVMVMIRLVPVGSYCTVCRIMNPMNAFGHRTMNLTRAAPCGELYNKSKC